MQGEENNAANMQLRELQGQRGEFRNCKSPIWDFNSQILVTKKNEKERRSQGNNVGAKNVSEFFVVSFSSSSLQLFCFT